jgi:hypothetical protein
MALTDRVHCDISASVLSTARDTSVWYEFETVAVTSALALKMLPETPTFTVFDTSQELSEFDERATERALLNSLDATTSVSPTPRYLYTPWIELITTEVPWYRYWEHVTCRLSQ